MGGGGLTRKRNIDQQKLNQRTVECVVSESSIVMLIQPILIHTPQLQEGGCVILKMKKINVPAFKWF